MTSPSNTGRADIRLGVDTPQNYTVRDIMPRFGSFVTHNDQYYKRIARIRQAIKTYINKRRPKRPLNILLAAPPGAGKSFLIKEIINDLKKQKIAEVSSDKFNDASIEEIYISALDNPDQLFEMFQRVQSLNLDYIIPVVFFDEIDSLVQGQVIYSKLLAPMWDGQFYIGKEKFLLGPAIFCFAGSTLSCEKQSDQILNNAGDQLDYDAYVGEWTKSFKKYVAKLKDNKLPDFVDRIDHILRIPPISDKFMGKELNHLELGDIVCMLVLKHHKERVAHIGKNLLERLSTMLNKKDAIREVERLIFSCETPVDEHFDEHNLPTPERDVASNDTGRVRYEEAYWTIKINGQSPVKKSKTEDVSSKQSTP